MSKAWRIISTLVMAALLVGTVCAVVGSVTGADFERIFSVLNTRYNLQAWIDYLSQLYNVFAGLIPSLF